jgi:predicted ATPase
MSKAAWTLLGKPSPLVGREREFRQTLELVEASFEEFEPSAILITAQAGMGKTRLLGELVRALRQRYPELAIAPGAAHSLAPGSALGLLGSALRGLFRIQAGEPAATQRDRLTRAAARTGEGSEKRRATETLAELLGIAAPEEPGVRLGAVRQSPGIMAERLLAACVDLLRGMATSRPLLVLLEDLDGGDGPSVKILDAALCELDGLPFVVLASARPEVAERFPSLWSERNVQEIRLNALPRRAAIELGRVALGAAATDEILGALAERAGGNPFFLEELSRVVGQGNGAALPETALEAARAHVGALPPETRRIALAASVFGDAFWKGGLLAVLGEGAGGAVDRLLADLAARELAARRPSSRFAGEEEWAFRHGLLRDASYEAFPQPERSEAHARAARWLLRLGEPDPAVLAEHFERAGDGPRAADFHQRAGEFALRAADHASAIARADRGLACALGRRDPGLAVEPP